MEPQHIPDKGEHLVRYYGWYSHRQRGIRKKTQQVGQAESDKPTIDCSAAQSPPTAAEGVRSAGSSTWAMLLKRVYEVDPLECQPTNLFTDPSVPDHITEKAGESLYPFLT